jgi:hypothetical protein
MKGIKQFGEDYKIEQTLAEMQFRHLVGDEKATEILKVEKNIQMVAEREAVHKADSYIRD